MTALIQAMTAARVVTHFDSDEDEVAMILRAQSGDKAATRILLDNYLGTLVNEVNRVIKRAGGFVQDRDQAYEDAFTDAILVFYRVIEKFRPGRGNFAGLLQTALRNDQALTMIVNRTRAMTIPRATMDRRAAALKAAEGDAVKARELAPQFGITRETYDAITQVFQSNNVIGGEGEWNGTRGTERGIQKSTTQGGGTAGRPSQAVPEPLQFNDPGYVRAEDLHDVKAALSVLDFEERDVICALYGLDGWPEHSQTELAAELGVSRSWVRKRLQTAMLKMQAQFNDKE